MYRVAAYITVYEDIDAALRCIAAITSQSYPVEKIFIIDNSKQDSLQSYLQGKTNIKIEFYPENLGISGGLRKGLEWAIAESYDFLWTFDQDSEPLSDVLDLLIAHFDDLTSQGKNPGIVAPLPRDYTTGQELNGIIFNGYRFTNAPGYNTNVEFYECDAVITSGSLVSISAAISAPMPREDLFIDAVDWDYCMGIRSSGYIISLLKNAILNHRFGKSHQAKAYVRKRLVTVHNYSVARYYYMCRNHTFIEINLAKKAGKLWLSCLYRFRFLGIMLIKVFVYEEPPALPKAMACLRGTFDGFRGCLGKANLTN